MTQHHHIKKLYRETDDRIITGLLAGVGKYIGIDAAVVRVGYIVVALLTGVLPLAAVYLISVFIVPERAAEVTYDETGKRIY